MKNTSDNNFSISNKTKGKTPSLPFQEMKEYVLGKNYELSLVFVSDKKSQELNKIYRNKNKPANILSFPLEKNEGEIFINLKKCKETSKEFDRKIDNFIAFLFIHGLTHLKGFEHSSKMESEEEIVRKKFNI